MQIPLLVIFMYVYDMQQDLIYIRFEVNVPCLLVLFTQRASLSRKIRNSDGLMTKNIGLLTVSIDKLTLIALPRAAGDTTA